MCHIKRAIYINAIPEDSLSAFSRLTHIGDFPPDMMSIGIPNKNIDAIQANWAGGDGDHTANRRVPYGKSQIHSVRCTDPVSLIV